MRIKEIAEILGVENKEVATVTESLRDDITGQGMKLAKKLTPSSVLSDDAVRMVMAAVDKKKREDKEAAEKARQEKEAADNAEENKEMARLKEMEAQTLKRQQEEAKRQAEEKLKKLRNLTIPTAPPAGPAGPAVTINRGQAGPPNPSVAPPAPGPNAPSINPAAPKAQATPPAPPAPPAPSTRAKDDKKGGDKQSDRRPPQRDDRRRDSGDNNRRDSKGNFRPSARVMEDTRGKGKRGKDDKSGPNLEAFATQGMEPALKEERAGGRRNKDKKKEDRKPDPAAKPKRKMGSKPSGPKRFTPSQLFKVAEGGQMMRSTKGGGKKKTRRTQEEKKPTFVRFEGDFTVGEFAEKIMAPINDVMGKLLMMGEMITINEVLNPDIAELLATEFEVEIETVREDDEHDVKHLVNLEHDEDDLVSRPPVVTVMGHVDHGKTTLLDSIREANVVGGEAGGITQHIGAYYVNTAKGDIVFLDTPGHEAITSMRARGADVTDLVILVVAANDGVKPQTVEAINHAKAANVPLIVAINKIDVEGANPTRVKQELMQYEIIAEEFGGDVLMVEVSAKNKTNLDELLENVALQSEILELKANPNRNAVGSIVESHVDPLRGAVATVLVQQGTLRMQDIFVVGTEFGRIRAMFDDHGRPMQEAGPATPVEILGITGSPEAGEQFVTADTEVEAREIAEKRQARRKMREAKGSAHISLESLGDHMQEGQVINLNLIVKADVQGSLEAVCASLLKIKSDKVNLKILHRGVGPIGDSDVSLADASDAVIIGFNVRPEPSSRDSAERLGVEIKTYSIIYDLLEEIEKAMLGMLAPEFEEVPSGRATIKEIFKVSKIGNIAGCFVEEGTIGKDHKVRVVRGGSVIWGGDIKTLRRVKDDVKEVKSGVECGIGLDGFNDIKVGDSLETYYLKEREASLMSDDQVPVGAVSGKDDDENE